MFQLHYWWSCLLDMCVILRVKENGTDQSWSWRNVVLEILSIDSSQTSINFRMEKQCQDAEDAQCELNITVKVQGASTGILWVDHAPCPNDIYKSLS